MARPKKQEVDYFPHYCDHGKVLFILENHFKNDGYAVFYKLEEILAKTEGHCYNCTNLENWEYLLSKMGTTEEIVLGVLQKLSAMGIIDAPLWTEKRIWMQSFVDSISDVYSRRTVDLPTKPGLLRTETPLSGINEGINPQSKLKESKVKETIESLTLPDWIPEKTWEEYLEMRKRMKKPLLEKSFPRVWKELDRLRGMGNSSETVLNQSIINTWQGVFEIKKPFNTGGKDVGIRTSRSDPRDTALQSRTDAEVAAAYEKYEASKAAARSKAGGDAGNGDAPDFQRDEP